MSIRFKFRSAASFDCIDLEGRPSISVRDLRSTIVKQKKLDSTHDFDLVFSDATTGQEFNDENFKIPSGSSVIIRRVPLGSVPTPRVPFNSDEDLGIKDSNHANPIGYIPVKAEVDNFDDFGVDLCPVEAGLSDSDLEVEKNTIGNEKTMNAATRLGFRKLEIGDLREAVPGDCNRGGTEEKVPQIKPKIEGHMKLEKNQWLLNDANCLAVQNYGLPSELKCSLCHTFFKEAVMIPCCQHSFCEKCICAVLFEKARCPKCSSSKCRVEDLLPNLSLRQAIEHFLESQILMGDPENAFQKYAPDGESGIQANDASRAVRIFKREPDLPLSPSATEKGSNQIIAESVYESLHRDNACFVGRDSRTNNIGAGEVLRSANLSQKIKQLDGERVGNYRSGNDDVEAPDFQGENQPINLPRTRVHEEADSTFRNTRGVWVNNGGGDRSYIAAARHRRGDRTCYMCGSPDHFIRDCPVASSPHPTLQTGNTMFPGAMAGYASPYWNGTPFPPFRPFTNMYGNPGMMPYNATMVPVTPYSIPPYMPPMYGGMPAPSGFLRMGDVAPPVGTSAERPLSRSEILELQECENRRKLSNDSLLRGQYHDDENDSDNPYEPGRSQEYKSHTRREKSTSHSEDSFTKRSQRKYRHDRHLDRDIHSFDKRHEKISGSSIPGRDRRAHHPERSSSGVEEFPHSSDRVSEEKYKHHHRGSTKYERRGHDMSDSSRNRHQNRNEKDVESRRVESVVKGPNRKHHSYPESGVEPNSSCDQRKRHREKDSSDGCRHPRHSMKPHGGELCKNRWHMVGGADEDCKEGYCHKRKRVH